MELVSGMPFPIFGDSKFALRLKILQKRFTLKAFFKIKLISMYRRSLQTILALLLALAVSGTLYAQPANDQCENAIALTELGTYEFTSIDAVTDPPGFPQNCDIGGGARVDSLYNDIWYTFTSPITGQVEFSTCGTAGYDTNLAIYGPGSSCNPTEDDVVACSEDAAGCSGFTSRAIFDAVAGETYLLRIGGWGPNEEGIGTFLLDEYQPPLGPENDDCENATEIILNDNDSIFVEFTSINANTSPPEHPEPQQCFEVGETIVHNDIWYVWTATYTGGLEWSNCGTATFDSRMAVYESTSCPPEISTLVGCSDDGADEEANQCGGFTSRALFNVEEGQTYYFRLGGFSASGAGTGTFYMRRIPLIEPPANDPCQSAAQAYIVTPDQADFFTDLFRGNTAFATPQPEIPTPVCDDPNEFWDVWYSFNSGPNTEVEVRINKETSNAEFTVDVFSDCGTVADTSWCFSTDEETNDFVTRTFTGFPGEATDYLIRVSTNLVDHAPGEFWFQLVGETAVSAVEELPVSNFRLFPNPARNQATVSFNLKEGTIAQAEILNALGQVAQREHFGQLAAGENRIPFSTARLQPGIYFFRLVAEGKQKTVRFVKE